MAFLQLNEKEQELANEFVKEHKDCIEYNHSTIGGHFDYIVTPTSIGEIVHIQCSICKKNKDITDYDCW